MKKRILALLLAGIMLGSTVVYADDDSTESEGSSASAPAAAAVAEASAPAPAAAETVEAAASSPESADAAAEPAAEAAVPATEDAAEPAVTAEEGADSNADADTGSEAVDAAETEQSSEKPDAAQEEPAEAAAEESLEAEKTKPTGADTYKYTPQAGDTKVSSMKVSEPIDARTGTYSEKSITIKSIELDSMSDSDSDYQYLKFTFSSGDDSTVYEGYVAGITIYAVQQEGNTKTADERITDLVVGLADCFYSGSPYICLSDHKSMVNKNGLCVTAIDTEKIASRSYTPETGDIDDNLCWAASASNMIEFSGWNDAVDPSLGLTDEDKIFDYFARYFTDNGSLQEEGIKWFMNGTNPGEDSLDGDVLYYNCTEEEDGEIRHNCFTSDGELRLYYTTETVTSEGETFTKAVYYDSKDTELFYYVANEDDTARYYYEPGADSDKLIFSYKYGNYWDSDGKMITNPGLEYGISTKGSQERIPSEGDQGNVKDKGGNLIPDYAEENVSSLTMDSDDCDSGDALYDGLYDALMGLKDKVATGLGIYWFNNETEQYEGGHAITAFGYIKEALEEGWRSLKALFVTDSDDRIDTADTRSGAVDQVTLYPLEVGTEDTGIGTEDVLYLDMGYEKYSVPILTYSVLQPCTSDLEKETEGTKDSVHSVDYAVTELSVLDKDRKSIDTVNSGDEIYLIATLQNRSYADLSDYNDPFYVLEYTMTCDGKVIDTFETTASLGSSSIAGGPYINSTIRTPYVMEGNGDYSISVSIEGVYYKDADGNSVKIQEAYFTNNDYEEEYMLTVKGKTQPDSGTYGTVSQVPSEDIPVFSELRKVGTKGSWLIALSGLADEMEDGLKVQRNGETLSPEDYSISSALDGSPVVTFTEAYLNTLTPGLHTFQVVNTSGHILAIIELTIR